LSTALRSGVIGTIKRAGWAPLLVLVFWATAAKVFQAYLKWPWLDMPTHFFGGAAAAYFVSTLVLNLRPVVGAVHMAIRLALSFGAVATAAVCWEFAEYASDRLQGTHLNLGVEDTLHDLLMGLLGGLAFVIGNWAGAKGKFS
jgi:hypothetical protein